MPCEECNRLDRTDCTAAEIARIESYETDTGLGILELQRMGDKIVPTLINGKPVDRAEWLEVVRIGNRSCSATLVGKNCAITAAHCGQNGSRSNVEIYNGPTIGATVRQMPQYSNSNYDLAILVLDSPVNVPGVRFATVGFDHQFQNGQDVDIAGYGCVRPGGGGGNDGILRFGESKVVGSAGTDVVTQWRPGGAALCFGDSGGPMFKDGSNVPGAKRTIIAVNSKGNIRDTNYNMKLNLTAVRDFLEGAASRYNLEIYGLNASHDPEEPEEPPIDPPPGEPSTFNASDFIQYCTDVEELHATWRRKLDTKPIDPGKIPPGVNPEGIFGL